jgi:hypothetical protein
MPVIIFSILANTYIKGGSIMVCNCQQGHGHSAHHGHGQVSHQSSCCCHGTGFRRFTSKEERIKVLEQYVDELRSEIQGAEEHLAELKKQE